MVTESFAVGSGMCDGFRQSPPRLPRSATAPRTRGRPAGGAAASSQDRRAHERVKRLAAHGRRRWDGRARPTRLAPERYRVSTPAALVTALITGFVPGTAEAGANSSTGPRVTGSIAQAGR